MAKEIVQFANQYKQAKIMYQQSQEKYWFNKKAIEVNENLKDKCEGHKLQLIQHHDINPFHHTNTKGFNLFNFEDKQWIRNFASFIENG